MESNAETNLFLRRTILCKTLAGNNCDMLTISNFELKKPKKKYCFISARIHPGESISSYIILGFITFLLSATNVQAKLLRDQYIFKIIPMLNPDGVIEGNYRCNLTGTDLNRIWNQPIYQLYPTICSYKQLIHQIAQTSHQIALIVDIHGHSRKFNTFVYGAEQENSLNIHRFKPFSSSSSSSKPSKPPLYFSRPFPKLSPFLERKFPKLMASISPTLFSYKDCNFVMNSSKANTMRVQICMNYKVYQIYTLESSFAGVNNGKIAFHYNVQHYQQIGQLIAQTLAVQSVSKTPRKSEDDFFQLSQQQEDEEDDFFQLSEQEEDSEGSNDEYLSEKVVQKQQKQWTKKKHVKHTQNAFKSYKKKFYLVVESKRKNKKKFKKKTKF